MSLVLPLCPKLVLEVAIPERTTSSMIGLHCRCGNDNREMYMEFDEYLLKAREAKNNNALLHKV